MFLVGAWVLLDIYDESEFLFMDFLLLIIADFGFCLDDFWPIVFVSILPTRLFTSFNDYGFIAFLFINYIREENL